MLIELFLPLSDPAGNEFPQRWFNDIGKQLNERFGGVTMYQRAPATGLWKQEEERTVKDELVIYPSGVKRNPDTSGRMYELSRVTSGLRGESPLNAFVKSFTASRKISVGSHQGLMGNCFEDVIQQSNTAKSKAQRS